MATALEIHGKDTNDAPLLPPLLYETAEQFDVKEVSADLGVHECLNLQTIVNAGAEPFVPFKVNTSPARGALWANMHRYYNLHREEFLSRYHQRSNVETTFHMLESKFGDSVRSKTARRTYFVPAIMNIAYSDDALEGPKFDD